MKAKVRINNQITAPELRVIDNEGENLGVIPLAEALAKAQAVSLDLIEISPTAVPPVAKIMDLGKYQYLEQKKARQTGKAHATETKAIQVTIGTGEHDLALKAKKASEFLRDGHRVKIELFLRGRAKYLDKAFLKERLERVLRLVSENYKVAEEAKFGPRGLSTVIERSH